MWLRSGRAEFGQLFGTGQRVRALKATWIGAAMSFAMAECVGLWAAFFPNAWLGFFGADPAMLETREHYLRIVGPSYGFLASASCCISRRKGLANCCGR